MQLPQGYECQVRPRSGLCVKHGISLAATLLEPSTPTTGVKSELLSSISQTEPYTITDGERIAQLVIKEYVHVDWEQVDRIDETERGEGGFGHTGVN